MKSKKKTLSWQTPVSIVLLVLGIAGFLWVFLPPANDTIILQMQEIRIPADDETYALLQDSYEMVIESPQTTKVGSQFGYSFELRKSDNPINVTFQDVDIYDYYQLNLSLEPMLENTTINPPGSVTTALLPGQKPAMIWKMEAIGKESITGIFWINIDFIPLNNEIEPSSTALLARKVDIPVQTVFGMATNTITFLATIFCVAAIFLGLPQLPFFQGETHANIKK